MNGSRSHTPDPLSPETSGSPATVPQRQGGASPTMQQRIKAIGVPTPLAISSPIRRYIILVHYRKINQSIYQSDKEISFNINTFTRDTKIMKDW